ncbi:MAG: chromosome segregation protein SMC [Anaerolineaceae bacterium]|nr:chromosome segregation protein SMC [Anaerolineaceae bacterium]
MASATITFYNEDGWLPIDFNEVSITRRAYRDGQNEYLLNGQKVRLKEIAELLGRSGLSERTYTIIGQGLVDAALSLKPEERRRFFEEAAGIGLYRARREEALNRLDTTRRNLERVHDILSELEPRLTSLEKQAKRAQEYERIRADLRLLLRDWYGFHWHRLQGEVVLGLEAFHAQEVLLERARARQAEVEVHQADLRGRLLDLRKDLNGWHTSSAELHSQWEKVSRSLAVMDERQRALHNQQQNLLNDVNRLEEEQKARQERLIDLNEERDRLQIDQEEADVQVSQARKNLEKRQAERGRAEQALRETRRSLVQVETTQVQLKAHQNEITNRADSLRKNHQSIAKTLENEANLLQELQVRLEKQVQLRQQAEQAQKNAEEALLAHRKSVAELETKRKLEQDKRSRFDAERARLAAQMEVLEQAERSLSGLANGAKYVLQEARQGRLKGTYQSLSGQLVVPAEYETAVAAALGEYLDGVLIEKDADIESVLSSLLSGSNKGRAVIFQPELNGMLPELDFPLEDGVRGLASRLVQAPEKMHSLLCLLLGQVLIVRDRGTAQRLIERIPPSARIVTLQGEVFFGSGVVIGGVDNRSSTIGRPRRIQELQSASSSAEQRVKEIQAKMQEIEKELNRLRALDRELENTLRQAGQALSQVNQSHQRATLEVEQVHQRHEFQSRQLSALDGQIQRAEQEIRQGQVEIEKNSKKIGELNDQVRDQNRALANLPVEELQAQMVYWNTAVAVVARALKDAERRLSEHRESIFAGQRQTETLNQRLKEAQTGLEELGEEKRSLREQEGALDARIEELRQQIEPAERQLLGVEKENSDLQVVFTTAQQAVTVADRHTTQTHLELTRVREALETLRRRVEDDFGLDAFESAPEVASQTPLPLEGMVEQLPVLTELSNDIDENISRQRSLLRRMGPINFEVETEYRAVKERYDFLTVQVEDLRKADADLREVISELDDLMRREFRKTFDAVAAEFKLLFTRLFDGGSARLVLSDAENPTEAGIDIEARLPGRREQGLSLLSGGERSLTAVALIFSLLKVSPTPFCVLDEVDAMLDESNVGRFRDLLLELSDRTQFILVTHNRNTVQAANVIYGVTMGRDSSSQVISLRLDEISDELVR